MQDEQKLLARALRGAANPAFITNAEGVILWVNRAFTSRYGHGAGQAVGQTPRLLQSGKHGPRYYKALWETVRAGRVWTGETVDRDAGGRLVTVRQTITPLQQDGHITHFLSIHADISAEAEAAAIAQRRSGTDAVTGLKSRAAFEAHCRDLLERAQATRRSVRLLLIAVEHGSGRAPHLEPHAASFVRGVVGERIRRALGREAVVGVLGDFDFAAVLTDPGLDLIGLHRQLNAILGEPMPLLGDTISLRCDVATALCPEEGLHFDELHRLADRRLLERQPQERQSHSRGEESSEGDMAIERE